MYIVSDLHFGHVNISPYEPTRLRLGDTVEKMDESLINLWNNVISKDDIVINLGDFSFHDRDKTFEILDRLNGVQVFIKGNHDKNSLKLWEHEKIIEFSRKPLQLCGQNIIFSHKPVISDMFNIHGHTHSKTVHLEGYRCVSVEQTGFKPVEISNNGVLVFTEVELQTSPVDSR